MCVFLCTPILSNFMQIKFNLVMFENPGCTGKCESIYSVLCVCVCGRMHALVCMCAERIGSAQRAFMQSPLLATKSKCGVRWCLGVNQKTKCVCVPFYHTRMLINTCSHCMCTVQTLGVCVLVYVVCIVGLRQAPKRRPHCTAYCLFYPKRCVYMRCGPGEKFQCVAALCDIQTH